MPDLRDATPIREPVPEVISKLEALLAEAKSGQLRGFLFVGLGHGAGYSYGHIGSYDLAELCMGIKLMELEIDSIVTHHGVKDDD